MPLNDHKARPPRRPYYLAAALNSIAVSAANTYVPLYLKSLGASYFVSGLPLVVRGGGRFAFDASSIYLMGRIHPQTVLCAGILVAALAIMVCGVFPVAFAINITYFFLGAGIAALQIALRQIVFDSAEEGRRGRAIGLLSVFIGVGPAFGIVSGGLVADYLGYRSLFIGAGALIVWLPFFLVYYLGADRSPARDSKGGEPSLRLRGVLGILLRPGAILFCACSFYSLFYQQARSLAVAFYATDAIGLSLSAYGLMRSLSQCGNISGRFFGGTWTDRSGVASSLSTGFAISGLAYGCLGWSRGFWSLLVVHTAIGFGAGLINVASQVGILSIVPPGSRGQAIGLYRSVGDLGMFLGPVVISASLDRLGFIWSFVWMAAAPLLFAAWSLLSQRSLAGGMRREG